MWARFVYSNITIIIHIIIYSGKIFDNISSEPLFKNPLTLETSNVTGKVKGNVFSTREFLNNNDSNVDLVFHDNENKEHILDNPDTYIGSIENIQQSEFIYKDNTSFQEKVINYLQT